MNGQPPAPSPLSDTADQDEVIWNAVWNATMKGIPAEEAVMTIVKDQATWDRVVATMLSQAIGKTVPPLNRSKSQ